METRLQNNPSLNPLLTSVDTGYLSTIDDLTSSLRQFGHALPSRPPSLGGLLSTLPDEAKSAITASLKMYLDIISTSLPELRGRRLDLAHLDIFCRIAGLTLADPGFMSSFSEGDICEVYTLNHQQVFRNLDFFKACSYDLFTLTAVPWSELFFRAPEIQDLIMKTAERILAEQIPALSAFVEPHLIQECYGGHRKPFLHTVKKAGCLFDTITREPKGYITIINVQELQGPEERELYS